MDIYSLGFTSILPVIVAFLTGVAGPVIVTFIRHTLGMRKIKELQQRKNDFNTTIVIQQKINNSINSFQSKHELDRIWIAQFHNGGNFYPGNKCMKKMSMTFESTRPGISADIMKMQNLPVSFFSLILQSLNTTQSYFILDPENVDDHALASFWKTRGIQKSYIYPIICIESGFIGLLGVDMITKELELSPTVMREIENEAKILTGYVATVSVDVHK
jgi:hypothetical protein